VKLVLSHNLIPSIDKACLLGLRFSLKELHMATCGLEECPEEVGALRCLKALNLSDNQLKDVPGNIG
jgi:Leucine-rich repeat (LRR) protein